MGTYLIKTGDIVSVNFNVARFTLAHRAEVLRVPVATGDYWIFRDIETQKTHCVSEGCTVSLIEKRETIPEKFDALAEACGPDAFCECSCEYPFIGLPGCPKCNPSRLEPVSMGDIEP